MVRTKYCLRAQSASFGPWPLTLGLSESNTTVNSFLRVSLYVLTAQDAIRGFIYDGSKSCHVMTPSDTRTYFGHDQAYNYTLRLITWWSAESFSGISGGELQVVQERVG